MAYDLHWTIIDEEYMLQTDELMLSQKFQQIFNKKQNMINWWKMFIATNR